MHNATARAIATAVSLWILRTVVVLLFMVLSSWFTIVWYLVWPKLLVRRVRIDGVVPITRLLVVLDARLIR